MPDIQNDIVTRGKVTAFQSLIATMTGETPQANYTPEYVEILFTPQQRTILQNIIEKNIRQKPGTIRINYNQIFIPPVLKVYGKYAIIALMAAYLIGRLTAK